MSHFMTTLTETLSTIPGLTIKEIPAEECQMTYGAKITHEESGMIFVVDCLKDWQGENGGDMWEVWGQGKEDPEMFFVESTRVLSDLPGFFESTLKNCGNLSGSSVVTHLTMSSQDFLSR